MKLYLTFLAIILVVCFNLAWGIGQDKRKQHTKAQHVVWAGAAKYSKHPGQWTAKATKKEKHAHKASRKI